MAGKKVEKKLYQEIEIPEGIEVSLENNILKMKKGDKDVVKQLLQRGKLLLAREVRYKNSTRNSYQFRVVTKAKLLEMTGNQHLYEVIAYKPGFHAKLYFDLDAGSKKDLKELCHALHDLGVSESIILDACEARLPFPNVVNERILGFL